MRLLLAEGVEYFNGDGKETGSLSVKRGEVPWNVQGLDRSPQRREGRGHITPMSANRGHPRRYVEPVASLASGYPEFICDAGIFEYHAENFHRKSVDRKTPIIVPPALDITLSVAIVELEVYTRYQDITCLVHSQFVIMHLAFLRSFTMCIAQK